MKRYTFKAKTIILEKFYFHSYTYAQLHEKYGVAPATVRNWAKGFSKSDVKKAYNALKKAENTISSLKEENEILRTFISFDH